MLFFAVILLIILLFRLPKGEREPIITKSYTLDLVIAILVIVLILAFIFQ